ncbi:MAG: response regulator transcription factor [Chloroflexota bacterium]
MRRRSANVLVVEDDPKVIELLRVYLERDGYEVSAARDGTEALKMMHDEMPDLVLLDIMLPELSGMNVCTEIRQVSQVPIIMLTARSSEADKITGLELGADDYVTKPFSPRELLSRVHATMRRVSYAEGAEPEEIRAGNLVMDPSMHVATLNGTVLDLTPTEFRVLASLARNPGHVLSRTQLADRGREVPVSERTIDVHVRNLRRKLFSTDGANVSVETVYGVGYRLTCE